MMTKNQHKSQFTKHRKTTASTVQPLTRHDSPSSHSLIGLNQTINRTSRCQSFVFPILLLSIIATLVLPSVACFADEPTIYKHDDFVKKIKPILMENCFDCHGDGAEEGGVSFDDLLESNDEELTKKTWHRVLKQVRADLMPPIDSDQPSDEQIKQLESWIIHQPLEVNPEKPDPGKLTIRRLNRVEYRNTVRDLLGVRYDTNSKFPADDTGHGFDNMADVLSISPLLLEKYFNAAEEIVTVVPTTSRVIAEQRIGGSEFKRSTENEETNEDESSSEFSYYKPSSAKSDLKIKFDGDYQLKLKLYAVEDHVDNVFDLNECEFRFVVDGTELLKEKFVRQGGKEFKFDFEKAFTKGKHTLEVFIKPITEKEQVRRLRLIVDSVIVKGPIDEAHRVKPRNYDRFFPRPIPEDDEAKRKYAGELLGDFAKRAFRRPANEETLNRLVELAEFTYSKEGQTFESGIAKAMTAVLASPRFVFREEFVDQNDESEFPLIDEYSLATRLSYFLWSSMPDQQLIELADAGELRDNLDAQITRMMNDDKFENFVENFAGQWLQARSISEIPINSRAIARRDAKPDPVADKRRNRVMELFRKGSDRTEEEEAELELARKDFKKIFRRPRVELDGKIRRAMRKETEMSLEYVVKNNRSVLELVDCNYTFLNESLAEFYKIEGVKGREMQRVELPEDSIRGGVLTQGTILAVTSNPDRTSPVKRGLFVLENLLGTPTSAPPPDIPGLEGVDSRDEEKLSLRESLALHREDPNCASCHNRMDPLGLALENFNAMGIYREQEFGKPIESKGTLITGESFENVRELKKILATSRKTDFYRCLTEKVLIYALGRSIEYGDITTVDDIVDRLEANDGQAGQLINGIINSAAFQRTSRVESVGGETATSVSGK